jgi:TetR/AcrR family transcriptional repressor of nem operon
MRYAPDHKAKTRARIVEAAGKVFRRQGYHAAGVDKVMEEAGLTAGGFYAHFASKAALLAEALSVAGTEAERWREEGLEELSGAEWLDAFLGRYLSMTHCQRIEDGCPVAALLSEVARTDAPAKRSVETITRALASKLARHAREVNPDVAEERALAALALCVGGLGLARSVEDQDLANRILGSCRTVASQILREAAPSPGSGRARRKGKGA